MYSKKIKGDYNMSEKYQYTNPTDRLDDLIDKMARGSIPMVDDLTMKEIEIRMNELAAQSATYEEDEDALEALISDTQKLKEQVDSNRRKATKNDVIIIQIPEDQKQKIRDDMDTSIVRSELSDYNKPDDDINNDREAASLKKRVSGLRRTYFHVEQWRAAIDTVMDAIKFDRKKYAWLTEEEYYKSIADGTIKVNIVIPLLMLDYNIIKDPALLTSIYTGETVVVNQTTVDEDRRVKLKDDAGIEMDVIAYTPNEVAYMQDMAAKGYDTPINLLLKTKRSTLYDRFLPTTHNANKTDPNVLAEFLNPKTFSTKFDKSTNSYKSLTVTDIGRIIYDTNDHKVNTRPSTNLTELMTVLSTKHNQKVTTNFMTNEVLINFEAAKKEAQILANIKSCTGGTT